MAQVILSRLGDKCMKKNNLVFFLALISSEISDIPEARSNGNCYCSVVFSVHFKIQILFLNLFLMLCITNLCSKLQSAWLIVYVAAQYCNFSEWRPDLKKFSV